MCSLCGKRRSEVEKLIQGPTVFICDECVDLLNEILEEELPSWRRKRVSGRVVKAESPAEALQSGGPSKSEEADVVVTSPAEADRELARLWHAFKVLQQVDARDQLLLHYAPVVSNVADIMGGPMQRMDLTSYGLFGLIEALNEFEPGAQGSFEVFAHERVSEAILSELRSIADTATP